MNILHLVSRFDSYDTISGVLDLSKCLIGNGHNSIITSSLERQSIARDRPIEPYYQLPLFERNIWQLYSVYKKLKQIIKADNIDVLHSHSALTSWIALFASRNTNIPLVTTCYNFLPKNLISESLILGKKVIVHHEAVGSYLINKFNLPRQRLQFIRQSIDLENFNFQTPYQRSKTDFNIAVILPLHADKGCEYFLKAMVKVVRTIPSIKIWIADSMPGSKHHFKEELELLVRRLALSNHVEFFDFKTLHPAILSRCNILVSVPEREDSSTRLILEAQACGVPVVLSRVAGAAETVLDNKTGILVSPKDHNALSNALIRLLRNLQFSRDIAYAARKRIEEDFDFNKTIGHFVNLYKQTKNIKNVLVINLGSTQDVVLGIPALRILKNKNHNWKVSSLITDSSRSLLGRCPYLAELLIYSHTSGDKRLSSFLKGIKLLIGKRFDIVIDFSNTFKTHLLSYLSLANKRYGYNDGVLRFLINQGTKKPKISLGPVQGRLAILSPLGIRVKDYRLELWPSKEDVEFVDGFLNDNWVGKSRVVGLDISSRKSFLNSYKSLECLAYLCDKLANQDMRVIIMGSKNSSNIKDELSKRIKSKPICPLGDISVMQLASLIKRCDIYISSNPDSLSLATTMKIPSIILSTKRNLGRLPIHYSQNGDVDVLTNEEIQSDMLLRGRRGRSLDNIHKEVILDKINRLIKKR